MDRRQALKTFALAAASQAAASPQTPPPPPPTPKRKPMQGPVRMAQNGRRMPQIIVFSQNLAGIGYSELGDIVSQMGFDGVDLTIRPGGHVEPRLANVDLVRAFEVMDGVGLAVPVITTSLTTPMDRTAVPVIALAGMSGAALFRPGDWNYGGNPNIMQRMSEVQRDFAGLIGIGRQYDISGAFHNGIGDSVGASVWDVQRIVEGLDPARAGIYFDICNATAEGGAGAWEIALRLTLPRIKAVTIQDFFWEKRDGKWQMTKCPLGQGMVDWTKFFQILAQANYSGPVTVEVGYPSRDMPSALVGELRFARKQVETAWGAAPKT